MQLMEAGWSEDGKLFDHDAYVFESDSDYQGASPSQPPDKYMT